MTGTDLNPLARVRLVSELSKLISNLKTLADGPGNVLKRLQLVRRGVEVLNILTGKAANAPESAVTPISQNSRLSIYSHSQNTTKGQREKANKAAFDVLTRVRSGEITKDELTEADRKALAGFSGNGGALVAMDDGKKGSAYEYLTPPEIGAGMFEALKELGFAGGRVLDPAAATGVLGAAAPEGSIVDSVELSDVSGEINQLLNDGERHKTTIAPFEVVAAGTPDGQYDAVISNVPFGKLADRGGNQLNDPKYQKETLENYFILRSLDKLRPGGLAAFIAPPRCVEGKQEAPKRLRYEASLKAEFVGAFRLPNHVFGAADADTITDVLFFRKHSDEVADQIAELRSQAPDLLSQSNVLWSPFVEGRYFASEEGKARVLGEFIARDKSKIRDADRVVSDASIPEVAQMIRKLPKQSRIDFDLIDAAETAPASYSNGDMVYQDGQGFRFEDGRFIAVERDTAEMVNYLKLQQVCQTPFDAFSAGVAFDQAADLVLHMKGNGESLSIPGWLAETHAAMIRAPKASRDDHWRCLLVGLAAEQVLDHDGRDSGVNFDNQYPALSKALKEVHGTAKRIKGQGIAKTTAGLVRQLYKGPKVGYSNLWLGLVSAGVEVATSEQTGIEGLRYKAQDKWLDLLDVQEVMGEEFNPFATDEWCISADGAKVCHADDYYSGRLSDFYAVLDAEIQGASGAIKEKLTRQRLAAESRVDVPDVDKIEFNLFSPFVSMQEKVDFLRRFVDSRATIGVNESSGKQEIVFDIQGSNLTGREKLLRRFAVHLKTGTVSTGGAKFDLPDKAVLAELRKVIEKANEQFNGWARANPEVNNRLKAQMSQPERLRFRQVDDESPLTVPGMHPDFVPHGFQCSWVRRTARDFAGINAFGTGLGKTFSALLAVQYAQAMGSKKKTLFVVPNNVISKWHKEAVQGAPGKAPAYDASTAAGCLFVGLREKKGGKFDVVSSEYDDDLALMLDNEHNKIFMTVEAFERLRLRDETIKDFEKYLRRVDASFAESEDKKKDVANAGKAKTLLAILTDKKGAAPYLEDCGIDSIVFDEGHLFKNSAASMDFAGAKFLSLSEPARRGLDAQAKAWYARGQNIKGDGVIPLTATPLTSSPLEVFSMLSLAYGHDRINDLLGGLKGADQFLNAICHVEEEEEVSIDGQVSSMRVFKGLMNVPLLRGVLHQVATVRDSEQVGNQITVPDAHLAPTSVTLPPEDMERLQLYKDAYRWARDVINEEANPAGNEQAFNEVSEFFGEPPELLAHPFNLINKMNLLQVDPDLDKRLTRYIAEDVEAAELLADNWNKKVVTEERNALGPNVEKKDVLNSKPRKVNGEVVGSTWKVRVKAWNRGNEVFIDSTDWKQQDKFEAMADKLKQPLDAGISPKLAALVSNFQKEASQPRGIGREGERLPRAKQLVFCDVLALHNKIKRILSKHCGVAVNRIAIVTGQRNNSPESVQAVQDGFNGGEFEVVIGNKKIEVGIDLQIGTQAIHHLTIGWTPDSITQRDGRGVRQLNLTAFVSVYHYDADGTFDSARRTLVNSKASWIGSLMDSEEEHDRIEISGGLTREQMEALIDVIGDADSVRKMQQALADKDKEARAASNRSRQLINLDTVAKQRSLLIRNDKPIALVGDKMSDLFVMVGARLKVESRLNGKNVSARQEATLTNSLAEIETRIKGLSDYISEGATFLSYNRDNTPGDVLTPEDVISMFTKSAKRGEARADFLAARFRRSDKNGNIGIGGGVVVQINDDSELVNDWAQESDLAKRMMETAVATYEKQAKHEAAWPTGVAEAFAAGQGSMIKGRPVVAGTFYIDPDKPEVLALIKRDMTEFVSANTTTAAGGQRIPYYRVRPEGRLIYPGTAEHDALMLRAAEYEDEGSEYRDAIYTREWAPVGALRKTEVKVMYSGREFRLPSPHFPVVLTSDYQHGAFASIYKDQSEVIERANSPRRLHDLHFTAGLDVDIQQKPAKEREIYYLLVEWLVANGKKAKLQDFGDDAYMVRMVIVEPQVKNSLTDKAFIFSEKLRLAEDVNHVYDMLLDELSQAVPWLDINPAEATGIFPSTMQTAINRAIYDARKKAGVASAPGGEGGDDDIVLIKGTDDPEATKAWKHEIKAATKESGGRPYWDRNNGGWRMKRKAFKDMIQKYPAAANEIHAEEMAS